MMFPWTAAENRMKRYVDGLQDAISAQWDIVKSARDVSDRVHGLRLTVSRLEREVGELRNEVAMYRELAAFGKLPGQKNKEESDA